MGQSLVRERAEEAITLKVIPSLNFVRIGLLFENSKSKAPTYIVTTDNVTILKEQIPGQQFNWTCFQSLESVTSTATMATAPWTTPAWATKKNP